MMTSVFFAKLRPAISLLVLLASPACLADIHYKCTSPDGTVADQIYKCGKGQESRKLNSDSVDPRSMESGAVVLQCSPCGPGYSWTWVSSANAGSEQLGNQRPPTNVASASSSDNDHAERCTAIEYSELKGMPQSSLIQTYCNYKKWAEIHQSNFRKWKDNHTNSIAINNHFLGNADAAKECLDQRSRILNVMENRNILPNC